jgi:uncharacterized membrane protein
MFEIFKLLRDVVVLREVARKDQYNWRIWPLAFGFVVVLYGVGISAVLLYEKHPQYKPLFIAALIFDVLFALGFIVWACRWQARMAAARKSAAADDRSH